MRKTVFLTMVALGVAAVLMMGCTRVECGKILRKEQAAMSVDMGDRVVVAWNAVSTNPGDKVCISFGLFGPQVTTSRP